MIQAVMNSPGVIQFRDIPVPVIKEREVLIKAKRIGICGSDIHVYHGKHPYTSYPVVQGHEVSGEIVQVGAEVNELRPGDKVTIMPQVFCGTCHPCKHGNYHICDNLKVMGFQTTGVASEYFSVSVDKVIKIPDSIGLDEGAMIEPVAVAVHAVSRGGDVKGRKVLVLGAGPIGNLIAQAAKAMGADKVMITDVSDYRLRIAEECNIDYCINSGKEDIGRAIVEKFGAEKADLILDCAGTNMTIDQAITNARKGTDIIVVAVFPEKVPVDLGFVQDRELRLIGTLMYKENDYRTGIELIKDKKIKLQPLITNSFPFKDYKKAYEFIEEKKDQALKIIINMEL